MLSRDTKSKCNSIQSPLRWLVGIYWRVCGISESRFLAGKIYRFLWILVPQLKTVWTLTNFIYFVLIQKTLETSLYFSYFTKMRITLKSDDWSFSLSLQICLRAIEFYTCKFHGNHVHTTCYPKCWLCCLSWLRNSGKTAAILSLICKANVMQSFVERIWTIGNIEQTK